MSPDNCSKISGCFVPPGASGRSAGDGNRLHLVHGGAQCAGCLERCVGTARRRTPTHRKCRTLHNHYVGRARLALDDSTGERRRYIHASYSLLGDAHSLVIGAEHDQRWPGYESPAALPRCPALSRRSATPLSTQGMPISKSILQQNRYSSQPPRTSRSQRNPASRCAIGPRSFDRGVLITLDGVSGSTLSVRPACRGKLVVVKGPIGAFKYGRSSSSQSLRPNSRYMQTFTSAWKPLNIVDMRAKREGEVDLAADALDQAADFGEVGRHVEGAVDRADDIDARLVPSGRTTVSACPSSGAEFAPQPVDRAVRRLPLVLVDRARNEPQQVRYPPASRRRRSSRRCCRSPPLPACPDPASTRPPHRVLGAVAGKLFLGKTGDHDRQFVRRQRVGVVQHGCNGQVFAAHRPVDHHPQPADRGERIDRAPVATARS